MTENSSVSIIMNLNQLILQQILQIYSQLSAEIGIKCKHC